VARYEASVLSPAQELIRDSIKNGQLCQYFADRFGLSLGWLFNFAGATSWREPNVCKVAVADAAVARCESLVVANGEKAYWR